MIILGVLFMLLELSFTLLQDNIYSAGVTKYDRHMKFKIFFSTGHRRLKKSPNIREICPNCGQNIKAQIESPK
jgi:hypothetical protein